MRQAIEQRRGELLVAREHGDPFGKREIRAHDGRSALVAIGDQIKEHFAAGPFERDESYFVDDEHVDAEESLLETRELARIPCFEELTHQVGGTGEEHASFLLGRFYAECDGEVGFAGPDRPGEDQILGGGDPLTARQCVALL